jgi:uncharacterized DUF497 family protein
MRFEWDDQKERRNWLKHKVRFDVALRVFDDAWAVSFLDRTVEGELRWQTIGTVPRTTGGSLLLLVAHTTMEVEGEEVIRIISARKATARERRVYEEGHAS